MEGDRRRRRDVERVDAGGHRDPHRAGRTPPAPRRTVRVPRRRRRAPAAGRPRRHRPHVLRRRPTASARATSNPSDRSAATPSTGRAPQRRERHPQHVPHRHPHRAPVQRIARRRIEHDTVDAEGGAVAEQRADVLVVVHALGEHDRAMRRRAQRRAATAATGRSTDASAPRCRWKPGHRVAAPPRRHVHAHVRPARAADVGERVTTATGVSSSDRTDRSERRRRQQRADDERALGDEEPAVGARRARAPAAGAGPGRSGRT